MTPNASTDHCEACDSMNKITKSERWNSRKLNKIKILGGFTSMLKHLSLNPKSSSSSDARPRKRALLIGVSYFDKNKFKLQGTTNDIKNMKNLLIGYFGYHEHNIRILTEEKQEPALTPKKKNIQESMKWLVEDCQPGDSLVFYFSGHGVRQPDFDGDESDGFDESICPVDFMEEGIILDEEIYATIVLPLAKGVTLHAIVDACHSGTIIDLVYVYNIKEKKWEEKKKREEGTRTSGFAISISACRDNQLAADTNAFGEENMMSGAMTYILQDTVKKNREITYGNLLESIHKFIEDANREGCLPARPLRKVFKYKWFLQKPQLSASEPFDVYGRNFNL